ncbi:hypothetical protein IQ249_05280 [Lusitaniella coriacea LEGE 07157]|uniref:Primosomal protein N' (Replication factor Y)-superfamily II helicase n=1 Tax=Lusitaniella coriacea LEGE 07157 TaxID=945747 RepID=A0A8J7B3T0_9CYAN|nr:hypothetical protein [Lusitaniella coriacea]MBE9115307.1 hypothetical protein [Lusitaniella coriacea LEGE 07157]
MPLVLYAIAPMTQKPSNLQQFPCPQCGANLAFNPSAGKLRCDYCGWREAIAETEEILEERTYEQYLNANQTQLALLSSTALEVACDKCGASMTFEPPKVSGKCPFCASPIVAQPKQADPTLAPEGIVPFTIGRKAARQHLQQWLNGLWFAPKELKTLAKPEKIQGVYLPFWTYDAQTDSHYRGERGTHYYVTETYTEMNSEGEEETRTRQVEKTRWNSVSGNVSRFFDDILVAATQLVPLKYLNALEPWHLKESLRPYDPSYLAGFEAQRSQVALEEGFETAKGRMKSQIRLDAERDIGGDEQRVTNVATNYSDVTFKHILLPVWLTAYRFRDRQYQVAINARTGEVQGSRPYSVRRIVLAVFAGICAAAIVIMVVGMIMSN